MSHRYSVLIYADEGGAYSVTVPALPGCVIWGRTRDEAITSAREAIAGHIAGLRETRQDVPEEERPVVVTVEVAAEIAAMLASRNRLPRKNLGTANGNTGADEEASAMGCPSDGRGQTATAQRLSKTWAPVSRPAGKTTRRRNDRLTRSEVEAFRQAVVKNRSGDRWDNTGQSVAATLFLPGRYQREPKRRSPIRHLTDTRLSYGPIGTILPVSDAVLT